MNNSKNTYLLTMPIFPINKDEDDKSIIWHGSILNYATDLGDGKIEYETRQGTIKTTVQELESEGSIKLFKLEDISIKNLLRDWSKKRNCYFLPFELDEDITAGEIMDNNFSPVQIMIEKLEDKVKFKLIFE